MLMHRWCLAVLHKENPRLKNLSSTRETTLLIFSTSSRWILKTVNLISSICSCAISAIKYPIWTTSPAIPSKLCTNNVLSRGYLRLSRPLMSFQGMKSATKLSFKSKILYCLLMIVKNLQNPILFSRGRLAFLTKTDSVFAKLNLTIFVQHSKNKWLKSISQKRPTSKITCLLGRHAFLKTWEPITW